MIPSLRQGLSNIMAAAYGIDSCSTDPDITKRAEYIRQLADALKVYADELEENEREC